MKKFLSLLLVLMLCVTAFAACGGKDDGGQPAPAPSAGGEAEPADGGTAAPDAGGDTITILYPGDESDRMTSFLANEFADRMQADLGLTVKMIFVPWDQYWDKKDIMLASKEPIDLYWDGLPDLSTMMNKKQCQPLDELIELYGQDMLDALPMEHIEGGLVDGQIYGIPSAYAPSSAMFELVCLRQDILEAVGMESVSTPDDLMEFSKKATEMFPNINGGGDPLIKPLNRYFADEPMHWVAYADLVAFGEESGKAISFYESEGFKKLSQFNREMTLAGLYKDDVTTKYNERDSRVQTGNYIWVEGSLGKETEIVDAVRANAPDAVMKSYLLAPEKPKYITAAGGEVLCIPYSAPNPIGAMRWINWLYSNQENYLFAIYGVEGTDYEIVDGRINRLINDELFYEWMFRNKNFQLFTPEADQDFIDLYDTWDSTAIVSPSFGFIFDNSSVKEIELRLQEVDKQFAVIRTGFVDFDSEYPKAVEALKEAGIDEYVAEVQRQLDEFIASKG